ncbi:hypothetical protein D9758_007188 [Tetrapyrgos nigripes]|uniref:CFEM domain-containing protein n=1 Tax=Tetrapyrgos nigripes TaxID=182062 RepID=A0A8H5D0S9_9AGAR|nr:hypothetical protein D9758_007188 [Tetrapyrgos nigripes]
MYFSIIFTLSVLATSVAAQSSTSSASAPVSTADIPPCVLNCIQEALPGNCDSISDINCLCTSTNFQLASLQCLQSKCSNAELETATSLQGNLCVSSSSSASGSASATHTSPASQSSTSSAHTDGNGASSMDMAAVLAMAFSAAGMIVGGALTF